MDRTMSVNEEDLLEVFAALPRCGEGLLTSAEIIARTGLSRWAVMRQLHKLKRSGKLIEGEKTIPKENVLGKRKGATVPAYGRVKEEK